MAQLKRKDDLNLLSIIGSSVSYMKIAGVLVSG